jgi:signal transduction histidine kinase
VIFIAKDFNIVIRAILVGYVSMNSLNNMDKPWVNVSIILTIIILSMLSYLLPKRFRKSIYLINIVFSAVATIYINKIIIILFAFTLAEYLSIEKKIYYHCLFIIPSSLLFTYKNNLCAELTSIITLSVYALIYGKKQEERVEFLEKEWDQNRRINSELSLRMESREQFIEQEKISVKLQERNEISGAMHDKIGHTLAGALLQLEP